MSRSPAAASRRAVLGSGGALGAAGALGVVSAAPAHAAAYPPAHYKGGALLSAPNRHLVSRFSYGITPALTATVKRQGGARKWFERQLAPAAIADTGADALRAWWSGLDRTAQELWTRQVDEIEGGWEVMADYQCWALARRMTSQRQVLELMTDFWENHLNVPVSGDAQFTHRVSYGDTVRRHALGRFEDLLHAAITHPAMLIYLNQAVSTKRHPNENLGRELLELHTVGRGSYGEPDVKGSARILTGWMVDLWDTWEPSYDVSSHWTGPVTVMGFSDANASGDGRALTRRYLTYLARHPATAQRIARKLARKFVRDDPPQSLVDQLARVYLAHDTAITPVLRALVASSAFAGAASLKVKDPGEDVVATYRALQARLQRPPESETGDEYAANAMLWQTSNLGALPLAWPRPDGQPVDNDSWSSPSRMIASMDLHYVMAGGWWPDVGITYRAPAKWLPQPSIRFDVLVDHLSQQLLGRRSTSTLLKACCEAVALTPGSRITADHGLVKWDFSRLLTTFLDSPAFLTR
ncbi:hypothetical protein NSZ01_01060 [Nocardioides szechwanensis]|uniref:DUF1800 domain-containing protein n=1 Tax=Nocardioides szechwanensis TaxID=1005944 RepID=A0A1G9XER3_9ACTN|nr:DUF1800 domain-containing protein [Nocardioides szechwanensis]GEP32338.1 hypothetical protein NSZ01_01060 [Nocardioides szechwanensis]SDM95218.1 Protein of unknown function [Nocardioides szechwanensis]